MVQELDGQRKRAGERERQQSMHTTKYCRFCGVNAVRKKKDASAGSAAVCQQ
jgi:hypothetical protein